MYINALTKKEYTGKNNETLALNVWTFSSNEYATIKQWQALGFKPMADQWKKGSQLVFFKQEIKEGRTENKLRYFWVLNREQVEQA
jgi:hypothetical protein